MSDKTKFPTIEELIQEEEAVRNPSNEPSDNRNMRKELLDKANQFKQVKNGTG